MTRLAALLFALILPLAAVGQSWPVHETVYVNDYANIIEEGAESRITSALTSLREETGVEATVLTLHTRWGYESTGSLESFATGLFNHWGIGNAERNDGILILVVSEDREMRIELGSGYGTAFNREAQDIVDRVFLPAFRDGDFSAGIEDGTAAVISRIAQVHAAGNEPAARGGGGGGFVGAVIGALIAVIAGISIFGRRISDRFSRCPQCGTRGIHTEKHTLEKATRKATGRGEKITTCPHCGYHATVPFTISRISSSSSSGGSFGGGSSSGGGASGRW
ncbi:TPM domain-containing protein [Sinisalibacter aestuarii]|uniref:TPM domain-containing protein n=1 Tax=Sinisalibacter aestuarii TaxID=2949426 RepID=A0ABQ5LRF1_9RHOB|nr:TPM domain-containing protein [Sinisalibacter aestuarii]GKY87582.1 hypothetical protein STA1M1_14510 [Sinisalibacter aestuarii]